MLRVCQCWPFLLRDVSGMLSTWAEGAKDVLQDSCALTGYLAYLGLVQYGCIRATNAGRSVRKVEGMWHVHSVQIMRAGAGAGYLAYLGLVQYGLIKPRKAGRSARKVEAKKEVSDEWLKGTFYNQVRLP